MTLLLGAMAAGAAAAPRGMRRPHIAGEPGRHCRPGHHVLSYHGGALVHHAAVFVIFWGPQWQDDPAHQAAAAALRTAYQQLGGDPFLCSLAEYALPGSPIGAASYLGDEIVASPPVAAPGAELDDTAIQQRIADEIDAGRAPVLTADSVYVVVPPQGVVVRAGAATGCGGSHFVFCGYHGSFVHAAPVRYAVLPFPCSQDRNTCFADAGEDPGRALQAIGSHEIAETITDPDSPPVGEGGWFDRRTGAEDADICESADCLVDLPTAAGTVTVNSLWSNLGQACVASAPCSTPPVTCTDPAPGVCVTRPGNARSCALEWLVDPNLTRNGEGLPGGTVTCGDGQPFCDFDGTADGRCTFHVALCLNNADPRLACVPTAVTAVQLGGRLARAGDPTAASLLAALRDVDPATAGTVSGAALRYDPSASTQNACSGYLDVAVPIRATGPRAAPGRQVLRLTARTAAGAVTTHLTLRCLPSFP